MTKSTVAGLLLAVAAVMLIVAGYNALTTIDINDRVTCGSWLQRADADDRSSYTLLYSREETKTWCDDEYASKTPLVATFGIVGLALGITGAVIAPSGRREPSPSD